MFNSDDFKPAPGKFGVYWTISVDKGFGTEGWSSANYDLDGSRSSAREALKERRNSNHATAGYVYSVRQVPAIPKKEIIYVAHPVSGAPIDNVFRTVEWIRWLTSNDPTRIYVAPWLGQTLAFPGAVRPDGSVEPNHMTWENALADDEAVLNRFDGLLTVGGRVSSGMQREIDCALRNGKSYTDMSRFILPSDLPEGFFLDPAY